MSQSLDPILKLDINPPLAVAAGVMAVDMCVMIRHDHHPSGGR